MTAVEVIGIILFIVFVLFVYYAILTLKDKRRLKKLRKNYDGKEDLSKKGEENRRRLLREGGASDKGKPSIKQFDKSEGRRILQAAVTDRNRKDSRRRRKTSKSPRGIFRKLRK